MLSYSQFSTTLGCIVGANQVARLKLISEHDRIRKHCGGTFAADEWLMAEVARHVAAEKAAQAERYIEALPSTIAFAIRNKYQQSGDLEWLKQISDSLEKPALLTGLDINCNNDDIKAHAKKLADFYTAIAPNPALAINMATKRLGKQVTGQTIKTQVNHIVCPKYWTRHVRSALKQHREMCHILLDPTNLNYCSVDATSEYTFMLACHEEWAAKRVLISDDGDVIPMPSPTDTQKNRYAQLVAQTAGIAKKAAADGCTASMLVTITLDSEYHPTTSYAKPGAQNPKKDRIRVRNKNYRNLSPRDGHKLLQSQWTLFRASISNAKIHVEFVIGVQPTGDETPHWHLVFFYSPMDKDDIKDKIEQYFRTNDNPAQINYKDFGCAANGVAYATRMLRYVTRQTRPEDGQEGVEEALNGSAWASTWKFRRYRTSSSKVTLWKLSRKGDVAAPDKMKACAATGDYFGFLQSIEINQARIIYEQKENSYGDLVSTPRGVLWTEGGETKTAMATKKWTIRKVGETNTNTNDGDDKQAEPGWAYSYSKEPRKPTTPQSPPETDLETDLETELREVLGLDFRSQYPPPAQQPQNFQTIH